MPHHGTYRRILAEVIDVEELDLISSQMNDSLDWPYLELVFMLKRCFTYLKTGEFLEQVI